MLQREASGRQKRSAARGAGALLPLAILLLAIAAVAPSVGGGFVYDDIPLLVENTSLRALSNIPRLLMSGVWEYSGLAGSHFFRPGQMAAYAVGLRLAGPNPTTFRLLVLSCHALSCLLVWLLARRWTGSGPAAGAAGLLFAVHPVHVEVAAWVSGLADAGMALFVLASLVFLTEASRRPASIGKATWCAAAVLSLVAGASFKEPALVLPALWALVGSSRPVVAAPAGRSGSAHPDRPARLDPERTTDRILWPGIFLLLVAVLASVGWRLAALGTLVPEASPGRTAPLSPIEAAVNAPWAFVWYLGRLLVPAFLSVDPPYVPVTSLADPRAVAGLALGIAYLLGIAFLWRRGERQAAAAAAWIPVSLLPVLDTNWVSRSAVAERYLYLPSVGFCILAGIAYSRLALRSRGIAIAVAALTIAAGLARSAQRAWEWRDDLSLFGAEVARQPANPQLRFWLAASYKESGRLADALREYRQSERIDPSFEPLCAINALPIAVALGEMTDEQAAQRYAEIAARARNPHPRLYANLGIALLRSGRSSEAAEALRKATQLDPSSSGAWAYYAVALTDGGDPQERLAAAGRAAALDPESLPAHQALALAQVSLGLWQGAASALDRCRRLGAPEAWCRSLAARIAAGREATDRSAPGGTAQPAQ